MFENSTPSSTLDYDRLNDVVKTIATKLSDPSLRKINNRAIQAKLWSDPKVASYMTDLRREEDQLRSNIMERMSMLIQKLHLQCIDATLERANIMTKEDDISPCTDDSIKEEKLKVDEIYLDAKERLYLILKEYGWMKDFFRLYPMHFFENSFTFVNNIPTKDLKVKVKVIGLGVGGSLAVSGLKKRGIEYVKGYEKRARHGERSVTSRYQNASWRAYDIAQGLLDKEAYDELVAYQQRINVVNDDGTTKVMTSDRVQIVLGSAIDAALSSAERYGAQLYFNCNPDSFYKSNQEYDKSDNKSENENVDIVALFTGAHTSEMFEGLNDLLGCFEWPNISSKCKMWLQIKPSRKNYDFTSRDVEVGAENWHFAIESARNTIDDVNRIRDALISQYQLNKKRTNISLFDDNECKKKIEKIENLIKKIEARRNEDSGSRFDYIFANAPDNEHNRSKIEIAKNKGDLVIDGNYQVDVKIASNPAIDCKSSEKAKMMCDRFSSQVLVLGGDACVPPNPMAAYGATLACEFAEMLVQLAVSHGHLNSICDAFDKTVDVFDLELINMFKELKILFSKYYSVRGRAENYFQWMQTLICNLYSIPPLENKNKE